MLKTRLATLLLVSAVIFGAGCQAGEAHAESHDSTATSPGNPGGDSQIGGVTKTVVNKEEAPAEGH